MMRSAFLAAFLTIAVAVPSAAQERAPIERRVDRIEKELRAVQRKVFPGGAGMTVEPEIGAQQPGNTVVGVPAGSAVADLTARVDSLESQLRSMTGQIEENAHRLRLLEQAMTRLRTETDSRLNAVEQPVTPRPGTSGPAVAPPAQSELPPEPASPGAAADPGEEAYLAGYRLWSAGQFAEAQKSLEATVKKYPRHARASYAQNLLGRAYLDGAKPATAAKVFLANYQSNPKGDRAPDSLYFLGQALTKLNKAAEACKVYDELQDVYGSAMRDWVKQRLPKARTDAKCS